MSAARSSKRITAWLAPAALVLTARLSGATGSAADDPFQMLQESRVVTAASKRPQPLSETPSIVTVITAAEIRGQGYRTLGEVLQSVRGFYTRYDRNYTYAGVRGLQRPGDYNNKVLLTIDGHTMNTPVYGDAAFGPELGLDMESVERIEVIRGPGSALYGSNAVLAVVNVVTRAPRASVPVETGGSVGTEGKRRAYLQLASARGDLPQVSFTGSWSGAEGAAATEFGIPAVYPAPGMPASLDGESTTNLLGSAVWGPARLTAKFNERLKHVPTGSYGTRLGDPSTRTRDGHDFVELSAFADPAEAIEIVARTYWDGSRYWGTYAFGPDSARVINRDIGDGDVVGAELRVNWRPLARHVATFGTEGRWVIRSRQENVDVAPYSSNGFDSRRWATGSFYVQDEVQLPRGARLTGGARLDGDTQREPVVSPRVDLLVPVAPRTVWKLLAGTAYRAPSPYETSYTDGSYVLHPGLLPERVNSVETAIQHRRGATTLTVSAYGNWVRDLIDFEAADPSGATYQFVNRGRVRGTGLESEIEWSPWAGGLVRGDVEWQESIDLRSHTRLSNSPPWLAHAVLTQNPAGSPVHFGLGFRWIGPRLTIGGSEIADVALVDARLALRPRGPVELGVEVRNVFNGHDSDPATAEHVQDAIPQDGRSVAVTLSFRRESP